MSDLIYDRTKRAIDAMFSDTSVSKETTRERLETLIEEINVMIESLGLD